MGATKQRLPSRIASNIRVELWSLNGRNVTLQDDKVRVDFKGRAMRVDRNANAFVYEPDIPLKLTESATLNIVFGNQMHELVRQGGLCVVEFKDCWGPPEHTVSQQARFITHKLATAATWAEMDEESRAAAIDVLERVSKLDI